MIKIKQELMMLKCIKINLKEQKSLHLRNLEGHPDKKHDFVIKLESSKKMANL